MYTLLHTILSSHFYTVLYIKMYCTYVLQDCTVNKWSPEPEVIDVLWRISREVVYSQKAGSRDPAPMLHEFSSYRQCTHYLPFYKSSMYYVCTH